eukprot:jgi/Mesvir1/9443/Mv09840-RA.1
MATAMTTEPVMVDLAPAPIPAGEHQGAALPFQFCLNVQFSSAADAQMVMKTLAVDRERNKDTTRELAVEGTVLSVKVQSNDVRTLRGSVGGFLDMLALASQTLDRFRASMPGN